MTLREPYKPPTRRKPDQAFTFTIRPLFDSQQRKVASVWEATCSLCGRTFDVEAVLASMHSEPGRTIQGELPCNGTPTAV